MTVQLRLGETILDAALDKLRNGLGARISQINAEHDDLQLKTPATADFYFYGVSGGIPSAPAIVVSPLPSEDEAESEGPHSFIYQMQFVVVIYEEDTDRGLLGRRLQRQARAVLETLWDDEPKERLTDSAFHLEFIRDDPGPPADVNNETSMWRGMHIVVFRAKQSEG